MAIPGSVPFTGFVGPTSELDTFATHKSKYGVGDKHVVDSIERDAITTERRVWGMLCHLENGTSYQLVKGYVNTDITNNANWVDFTSALGANPSKLETNSISLTAEAATTQGDLAVSFTLTSDAIDKSYIMVDVNGKLESVGDTSKTLGFYFSGDSGTTARSFDASYPNGGIQTGDELYLGSNLGYVLDITDKISIYQLKQ